MKILIEGPSGSFLWSEIIQDAFKQLGHDCIIHYHNKKNFRGKINKRLNKLLSSSSKTSNIFEDWASISNNLLLKKLQQQKPDILFSIQGKLTPMLIKNIKRTNSKIKIIYWWGDILSNSGQKKMCELEHFVDAILMSYPGDIKFMQSKLTQNIEYFPFGVSQTYHLQNYISGVNQYKKHELSFVGTYYKNRCETLHYLNTHCDKLNNSSVQLYGRSWRRCKHPPANKSLALNASLEIYQQSKISLNIHHYKTNNGLNMKFFEIPASGGFQLCDYQAVMDTFPAGKLMVSYDSLDDLCNKVEYYLSHNKERLELAKEIHQLVITQELYTQRLKRLLRKLDLQSLVYS